MQRQLLRALTTSIYPLIGLAGLLAMPGCAALPAINMANSLMKPAQPAVAGAPSPDMFSQIAQHFGITLPAKGGANTAANPGANPAGTQTAAVSPTPTAADPAGNGGQ
jgi:hypothetical protein